MITEGINSFSIFATFKRSLQTRDMKNAKFSILILSIFLPYSHIYVFFLFLNSQPDFAVRLLLRQNITTTVVYFLRYEFGFFCLDIKRVHSLQSLFQFCEKANRSRICDHSVLTIRYDGKPLFSFFKTKSGPFRNRVSGAFPHSYQANQEDI